MSYRRVYITAASVREGSRTSVENITQNSLCEDGRRKSLGLKDNCKPSLTQLDASRGLPFVFALTTSVAVALLLTEVV